MRLRRIAPALAVAVLLVAVPASAERARPAAAPLAPLATGLTDPWVLSGRTVEPAPYAAARKLGAGYVRLYVAWERIAPTQPSAPRNPNDPAYHWDLLDRQLTQVAAHGMTPIVNITSPPSWAGAKNLPGVQDNPPPDPDALGAFAEAAARRYDVPQGSRPRVRNWLVWNEPNLGQNLKPQRLDGKMFAPGWYRAMVIAFGRAVKSVSRDNVVIAGALAPFHKVGGISPFNFTREFFCLNENLTKKCNAKLPIDVWGIHPYTWGNVNHKAPQPGDLSLGDLPALRTTLAAATRSGNAGRLRTWTTEFCWASNPPTKGGVPMATLTRWVAEALYHSWANGVTNVIWFQLYDLTPGAEYHCGLDTLGKKEKPAAAAFRFPFVAYPGAQTSVWGRTPTSKGGTVTIQARQGSTWKTVATLKADTHGMFATKLALPTWTQLRARFGSATSPAFSAKAPPDPKLTTVF